MATASRSRVAAAAAGSPLTAAAGPAAVVHQAPVVRTTVLEPRARWHLAARGRAETALVEKALQGAKAPAVDAAGTAATAAAGAVRVAKAVAPVATAAGDAAAVAARHSRQVV
jgi:hypothetical protein